MFHHLSLCPCAGISFSSNVKQQCKFEHWFISQGTPKITLSKESFSKKNDHIFIQLGKVHKIQNLNKKSLKIIEAQVGSLLKETDIVRYHDIYEQIKQRKNNLVQSIKFFKNFFIESVTFNYV